MTTDNPYSDLPGSAFWRSGVVEAGPQCLVDVYARAFDIGPTDQIATAGSCFAQHIGRRLVSNGYRVIDAEPAPRWLTAEQRAAYGYGVYSARYGNIYTVAQLAQLAAECMGEFTPGPIAWRKGERFIDALRPGVDQDGYATVEDLQLARRCHLERVRSVLATMDVFIFTLGLTEAWIHKPSETIVPIAPGVMGGTYDPVDFAFVNFGYLETAQLMQAFLKTLAKLRGGRMPRVILTVSPIPLTATASGNHVLAATNYSKSVLRAVAGDVAAAYDFVAYFPAYEIVTNPAARSAFFDANLRTVRPEGVQAVMDVFFGAHPPLSPAEARTPGPGAEEQAELDAALQCEDAILAAFSP